MKLKALALAALVAVTGTTFAATYTRDTVRDTPNGVVTRHVVVHRDNGLHRGWIRHHRVAYYRHHHHRPVVAVVDMPRHHHYRHYG